jgi:uncharacterized membrane protein YfcA
LGIFTHSVAGFGLALVSVPILAHLLGIRTTTPLIVLVAISVEIILILRYREDINVKAVWQLVVANVVGIPVGVLALKWLDEEIVLTALGIVIIFYAIYALLKMKMPRLQGSLWAYGFGFAGGVLGGAYNIAGPAVVIYGDTHRWDPVEFKGNLQGYFMVGSITAIISHWLSGNMTAEVWKIFLITIPAIVLGLLAGLSLDKYLDPLIFRKIVLIGLTVSGLSLLF